MILVAGASGNVGGELVRALAETGEPVRGLVRGGRENALPEGVEAVGGTSTSLQAFARPCAA